jgi:hypothetical protein
MDLWDKCKSVRLFALRNSNFEHLDTSELYDFNYIIITVSTFRSYTCYITANSYLAQPINPNEWINYEEKKKKTPTHYN